MWPRLALPLMLLALAGAPAHAGLRVYDAASGQSVVPSATVPLAPVAAPARPALPPAPSTASPQPVLPLPVAGSSVPASADVASGLGTALIFIKGMDFSELVASKAMEISRIPGLDARFYLQDEAPRTLVGLARSSLKNMPQGVAFNVDLDSRMAQSHGVVGQNVIVYRDPSGAVRHYNLVSEYANFLNHVNRLRGR